MTKIVLPENYKPSEDEEYMNPLQLEYFKNILTEWKNELLTESQSTIENLKELNWNESDVNDRASLESETSFELRTRNRYRKLIDKIDLALDRIKDGSYGYCEETGEPIGIKRLKVRPATTLCLEAQERHEKYERQHSDED